MKEAEKYESRRHEVRYRYANDVRFRWLPETSRNTTCQRIANGDSKSNPVLNPCNTSFFPRNLGTAWRT